MRFIIVGFFFFSLILFLSVHISPEKLSYTGLLPFLIPPFLVLNILLVLLLLFGRSKFIIFPVIALVIGWKFFNITFQWNQKNEDPQGISLLSYNTMMFNHSRYKMDNSESNAIQWVRDHPAEIKCLQEFYQDYTTPSRNAIKIISEEGKLEYAYHIIDGSPNKRSHGIAIFSQYPIINEGKIFDNQRNNGAIFVDLKIKSDTLRVYNTHLESMSIKAEELGNVEGIKENYRETIRKLKTGISMRANQVNLLKEHIRNSPHPVILAGDFNDVPYSYTYFSLKSILSNAFEEAGRGFGFTFNKVLFFLRIDNIFYDGNLEIQHFNTYREVDYSDHYPISATFRWQSPVVKKEISRNF